MTKIILIRHGNVEGAKPERFRGRADLGLTPLGAAQATATVRGSQPLGSLASSLRALCADSFRRAGRLPTLAECAVIRSTGSSTSITEFGNGKLTTKLGSNRPSYSMPGAVRRIWSAFQRVSRCKILSRGRPTRCASCWTNIPGRPSFSWDMTVSTRLCSCSS